VDDVPAASDETEFELEETENEDGDKEDGA